MNARLLLVTATTSARRTMAEWGGLVVTAGFYAAVIVVLGSLWRAAAHAHGGRLAGYSGSQLTWYIAASEAATVSLNVRLIEDIGNDIASGAIVVELLRPASVLAVRMAAEFGRALPRLALCLVTALVVDGAITRSLPSAAAGGLAVIGLLLAIACNLAAQHAFASAAFWVRDARSTWFLYQKLVFVVGGMLLPLEVLPGPLEHIAKALPFMAMAYVPGRLASGHVEPALLGVQVLWCAVLVGLAVRGFAAGERRLQVVGG
jgi:ABC-2 type transport system permease protein